MLKHFGIMLIASILVGIIYQIITPSIQYLNTTGHLIYLIGYLTLFSIIYTLICVAIALIPHGLHILLKDNHIPCLRILTWSVWILVTILFFSVLIYQHYVKPELKSQISTVKTNVQSPAHNIYQAVNHSVFMIYSENDKGEIASTGTAVAVSEDYLATNCHIIGDKHFKVIVNDNKSNGELYSQHGDLCIVKVLSEKFIPVDIRFSKNVEIGEDVYAIGNPKGLLKSISKGIISNKFNDQGITILQTDAALSHGSSGGGLFDHHGKLIGITTMKLSDAEGIGFVIPTETIEEAILDPRTGALVEEGSHPSIKDGHAIQKISAETPTAKLIQYYGEHKIGLFHYGDSCLMTFTGKDSQNASKSMIVWFPDNPRKFYVFPNLSSPTQAINDLTNYLTDHSDFTVTSNILVINHIPYQLDTKKAVSKNKPIYSVLLDINPTKLFNNDDYFSALFNDSFNANNERTDHYNLSGFSQALAGYRALCE